MIIASAFLTLADAQNPLVPNGSFEDSHYIPLKWNKTGTDFSGILYHWSSPNQASPDVYGPGISIPDYWSKKGFGFMTAKAGKFYTGLTLYGCIDGKPHCREYLQVRMDEPLVPGQQYEISFWVSPLPRGFRINNLGVAFSYDSLQHATDEPLNIKNAHRIGSVVQCTAGYWRQIKIYFKATARESFLLIGNFSTDKETRIYKDPIFTKLKYAYYYFDDVKLKKIPPIIEYQDTTNTYIERQYDLDETVILENVYFDFDQVSLKPKSYLKLAHLLEMMNQYPEFRIELRGHTDNIGGTRYNDRLSQRRAKVVYDYLCYKGVDPSRLSYNGYGEKIAIRSNDNEEGRKLNRRVEFKVLYQ
jgi:outer membrane protein OmpA-like peptidoglycan-associated protein